MKIWRFSDPRDDRFASAGRRGAWTAKAESVCAGCTASMQVRAQPLILEWEPGSDEVGDFVWPGFGSEVVGSDRAIDVLEAFGGFEPGPVEYMSSTSNGRGKQVRLPYEGPRLREVWVTATAAMDRGKSTAELTRSCTECGREQWELHGVERWDSHFDAVLKRLVRVKLQRLPESGIFVESAQLAHGIFRMEEFPAWVFCTDDVRRAVEQSGCSNVSFLEMGEAI